MSNDDVYYPPNCQACPNTGPPPPPPFLPRSTRVDDCSICGNTMRGPSSSFVPPNPPIPIPAGWLPTDPDSPKNMTMSVALGRCGHKFHLGCVQHTLKIASKCVVCGEEFSFVKIVKIQDYDDLALETNNEDEDDEVADLFEDDRQSVRKSVDDNEEIQQQLKQRKK